MPEDETPGEKAAREAVKRAAKLLRWSRAAAGRAVEVGVETRDAFRRGLRGEAEPPPKPSRERLLQQVSEWYANLEVEPGADLDEVERAWKALQRRYHPDLHSGDPETARRATELIQQINEAYAGLRRHLENRTGSRP